MRSTLIAFLLLSCFSTFAQLSDMVSIHGKFPPKGTYTMIYLDTLSQNGSEDYAAAAIDADGKFELKAPVPKTNIFKLRLEENNYLMLILSPGENISLTLPSTKLGIDATVKGSLHTELLYRAINAVRAFDLRRDSLNTLYNTIQSSPSRDSIAPLIIDAFAKNDSLEKVVLKGIIEKSPASLAWIFVQDKLDMTNDFAFIDRMERAMYDKFSYNIYMQQYHQQIEVERKTAIGSQAPDITLPDPEGNPRSLSSLKGKVVLVDFWASWCGPCRKENPNVVKAYTKYHDKGFEVFSVSLDKDRESWLKAIAADKLSWPNHVSDLKYWKSAGAAVYGVSSIPFAVLIDKEGKIVAKKLRGDALENKLEELLK